MSSTTSSAQAAATSVAESAAAAAVQKQVSEGFAYALNNVPDVAKPVVGTSRDPPANKVGHKCCGGCCDVRRAVIIVNSINLGFGILGFFSILFGRHVANHADQYDGYDVSVYQNMSWTFVLISSIIHLLITAGGIVGGLKYHIPLVTLAGIMYALDTLMSLIGFNFIGVIVSALFAYPHYFLVQEIKQGIMTAENYHNEEHSCCCV